MSRKALESGSKFGQQDVLSPRKWSLITHKDLSKTWHFIRNKRLIKQNDEQFDYSTQYIKRTTAITWQCAFFRSAFRHHPFKMMAMNNELVHLVVCYFILETHLRYNLMKQNGNA